MIDGVGIDLIEIARVRQAVDRWGDRFLNRIFTPAEVDYCRQRKDPYPSLAARFAAKEAVMKSLGTGWSTGIKWTDIEIGRNTDGPPFVRVTGRAQELVGRRTVLVSLSHTADYAVAAVTLVAHQTGTSDDAGTATGQD